MSSAYITEIHVNSIEMLDHDDRGIEFRRGTDGWIEIWVDQEPAADGTITAAIAGSWDLHRFIARLALDVTSPTGEVLASRAAVRIGQQWAALLVEGGRD